MSLRRVNPYIILNGAAGKAIQLYESALDAKTEAIMRYGDIPGSQQPPEQKDKIMHAMLHVGEGVLMLSDAGPGQPTTHGDSVQIALDYTDKAEMAKAFAAMSAGGTVVLPLQDMFWGAHFGMLTDAYGIRWMFNCELKKA
jgi:PhnB protein